VLALSSSATYWAVRDGKAACQKRVHCPAVAIFSRDASGQRLCATGVVNGRAAGAGAQRGEIDALIHGADRSAGGPEGYNPQPNCQN
jgi:hypothetical protein